MYSLQAYASKVPIVIGRTPARVEKFYAQLSCFLFLEDYRQRGRATEKVLSLYKPDRMNVFLFSLSMLYILQKIYAAVFASLLNCKARGH
jgi:hypothetical protein